MTLQAWVQLLFSVAVLAAAFQTQTGWLFVLGSLAAGGLAAAWTLARWNMHGVELEARPPGPVERGGWLHVPVVLRRRGAGLGGSLEVLAPDRWPRWYGGLARDALIPAGWSYVTLTPPADAPAAGVLLLRAERRGEQPLPRLLLQSSWPLGLVALWRPLQPPGTVVVYPRTPRVASLPWLDAAGRRQGAVPQLRPEAGAWLRGVREHRPGESLRGVHWPTVSRTGRLHVRDTEQEAGEALLLWLDLRREVHDPATLEHLLEVAAALVALGCRAGRPVRLSTQAGAGLPDGGGSEEAALTWLARARATAPPEPTPGPPG
ncbi:MAG: DUF58 domain-containing protein, partial [Candidatus Sericytochromatia bacterium]|nr:DUF58 domain-containing protein [Candidatus Sericytochromatia bacterium]